MFCDQCGTKNRDEAKFCISCGNKLFGGFNVNKSADDYEEPKKEVPLKPFDDLYFLGFETYVRLQLYVRERNTKATALIDNSTLSEIENLMLNLPKKDWIYENDWVMTVEGMFETAYIAVFILKRRNFIAEQDYRHYDQYKMFRSVRWKAFPYGKWEFSKPDDNPICQVGIKRREIVRYFENEFSVKYEPVALLKSYSVFQKRRNELLPNNGWGDFYF